MRALYASLGFFVYFRNIDACFWECYAPEAGLIDRLRDHFNANSLDYEELDFAVDFPFGGLKRPRKFKGVRTIWPPEK